MQRGTKKITIKSTSTPELKKLIIGYMQESMSCLIARKGKNLLFFVDEMDKAAKQYGQKAKIELEKKHQVKDVSELLLGHTTAKTFSVYTPPLSTKELKQPPWPTYILNKDHNPSDMLNELMTDPTCITFLNSDEMALQICLYNTVLKVLQHFFGAEWGKIYFNHLLGSNLMPMLISGFKINAVERKNCYKNAGELLPINPLIIFLVRCKKIAHEELEPGDIVHYKHYKDARRKHFLEPAVSALVVSSDKKMMGIHHNSVSTTQLREAAHARYIKPRAKWLTENWVKQLPFNISNANCPYGKNTPAMMPGFKDSLIMQFDFRILREFIYRPNTSISNFIYLYGHETEVIKKIRQSMTPGIQILLSMITVSKSQKAIIDPREETPEELNIDRQKQFQNGLEFYKKRSYKEAENSFYISLGKARRLYFQNGFQEYRFETAHILFMLALVTEKQKQLNESLELTIQGFELIDYEAAPLKNEQEAANIKAWAALQQFDLAEALHHYEMTFAYACFRTELHELNNNNPLELKAAKDDVFTTSLNLIGVAQLTSNTETVFLYLQEVLNRVDISSFEATINLCFTLGNEFYQKDNFAIACAYFTLYLGLNLALRTFYQNTVLEPPIPQDTMTELTQKIVVAYLNLSSVFRQTGQYQHAVLILIQAEDLAENFFEKEHPLRLLTTTRLTEAKDELVQTTAPKGQAIPAATVTPAPTYSYSQTMHYSSHMFATRTDEALVLAKELITESAPKRQPGF